MSSPEYKAGLTTPMIHPDTGNPIAGAAAQATRNKLANGQVAMMNLYAANAVREATQLMELRVEALLQKQMEQYQEQQKELLRQTLLALNKQGKGSR